MEKKQSELKSVYKRKDLKFCQRSCKSVKFDETVSIHLITPRNAKSGAVSAVATQSPQSSSSYLQPTHLKRRQNFCINSTKYRSFAQIPTNPYESFEEFPTISLMQQREKVEKAGCLITSHSDAGGLKYSCKGSENSLSIIRNRLRDKRNYRFDNISEHLNERKTSVVMPYLIYGESLSSNDLESDSSLVEMFDFDKSFDTNADDVKDVFAFDGDPFDVSEQSSPLSVFDPKDTMYNIFG